jgi:hypothetical protein
VLGFVGVGATGSRVGCDLYIWVIIWLCVSYIAWISALLWVVASIVWFISICLNNTRLHLVHIQSVAIHKVHTLNHQRLMRY